MTTFWDGLEVPVTSTEYFADTLDANGQMDCALKYVPRSVNELTVSIRSLSQLQFYSASLSGKTVTVTIKRPQYDKPNTPIGTENSGGAGADPHSHALAYTATNCTMIEAVGVVVGLSITYAPART